jgi:hypothetical protein
MDTAGRASVNKAGGSVQLRVRNARLFPFASEVNQAFSEGSIIEVQAEKRRATLKMAFLDPLG